MTALAGDRRGATAVEFALLAPIFLGMLFTIVEGSRMLWIKQSINEVAFSTARCASVSGDCETVATQKSYAVARARTYGQTIGAADVVPLVNTTCNATAGMVKVTIATRFDSPVAGLIPGVPAVIEGVGCYPAM
jgi:Flp pilus assembly protein TadG